MVLPGRFQRRTHHAEPPEQRKARREGAAAKSMVPTVSFGGKPAAALIALALFVIIAALFGTRSSRPELKFRPLPSPRRNVLHELRVLRIAVEDFHRDVGRYPTTEEGLIALIHNPGLKRAWKGPYVTVMKPDPWKEPYQYAWDGQTLTLFSCGPDHLPRTADDYQAPAEVLIED
jgi:type II secretion system protein G